MTTANKHSEHSSIREEYLEYIFLAQLCSFAWQSDEFVEVSRTATDAFGYDVVLSCKSVTRHIQLKASVLNGSTRVQKINSALGTKEAGCVIWMVVDPTTLTPDHYLWFGGATNMPLPDLGDRIAKHTKANAEGKKLERNALRVLRKTQFERLDTIGDVFVRLFESGD